MGCDSVGGNTTESTPLRLLDLGEKGQLWIYINGIWKKAEAARNRNYLTCGMNGHSATYCMVKVDSALYSIIIIIPIALLFMCVIWLSTDL